MKVLEQLAGYFLERNQLSRKQIRRLAHLGIIRDSGGFTRSELADAWIEELEKSKAPPVEKDYRPPCPRKGKKMKSGRTHGVLRRKGYPE